MKRDVGYNSFELSTKMKEGLSKEAKDFLNMLKSSERAVALTGAGISTESGIPDYRSPGTGLWEKMDQSIVSLEGFLSDPSRYFSYALELYPIRSAARPNPTHYLLAELERRKLLRGVLTQNIDGLHQEAGSVCVCELHGSLRRVICLNCGSREAMDSTMKRVKNGENPPLCRKCGGILKPDAVFFGEALPNEAWNKAISLIKETDLFIIMGTSLQVSPVNLLPSMALDRGARLVIVNLLDTPYDKRAALVINCKSGELAEAVFRVLNL